jgi:hypothetical protein
LLFGVLGLILLTAAIIPQLWFPDGPISPTWRLVSLFAAAGLLAGALGAFNRWAVASRQARMRRHRATLGSINARASEQEFDNPPTTYPLREKPPGESPGQSDRP